MYSKRNGRRDVFASLRHGAVSGSAPTNSVSKTNEFELGRPGRRGDARQTQDAGVRSGSIRLRVGLILT